MHVYVLPGNPGFTLDTTEYQNTEKRFRITKKVPTQWGRETLAEASANDE